MYRVLGTASGLNTLTMTMTLYGVHVAMKANKMADNVLAAFLSAFFSRCLLRVSRTWMSRYYVINGLNRRYIYITFTKWLVII